MLMAWKGGVDIRAVQKKKGEGLQRLRDYPGNSANTALTGWQTLCPEYVIDFPRVCICVCVSPCVCVSCNIVVSLQKREGANYNIKAVSTNDLSAFALCAITLNQERSAVDVSLMHKLDTFTNPDTFFLFLCFLLMRPVFCR